MLNSLSRKSLVLLVTVALLQSSYAVGALTKEQQSEITRLKGDLRKIGTLFGKEDFQRSVEEFAALQERVEKLAESEDEDVLKALSEVHKKMVQAHALLELEGVELAPVKELVAAKPTPSPSAGPGSSFVKDIAPLLMAKCGGCHIDQDKGDFSMPSYAALMRGSAAGVVIFPGDPSGSRLIELIDSGDMPRGSSLSAAEKTSLKSWIAAGAKFDGENPQANLSMYASANGTPAVAATFSRPTGNETVSFSEHIAPVLAEACFGCHVGVQRARGNFNMTTFQRMTRPGDSDMVAFTPGQPMSSLIIQRLKGEGGEQQMPVGKTPLSDEVIATFEKWIAEGAKFDGPDPNMEIIRVAALAKARNSTHDELSADRMEIAMKNWDLGMAGAKSDRFETKNFFLVGNVGNATLEEYGKKAEQLAPRVASIFGAPSSEALIKGRMTLFLFRQRYDYSEFGNMVEKTELPKEWRGHWKFSIVDAYGAMIPPTDDSYTLDGLVAQQLAGTYMATLNNPPRWFSEGAARVAASRLAPKDGRVASWKSGLKPALAKMQKADDFMNKKLPPEDADIAAFSFVDALMKSKNAKNFDALLDGLRQGNDFNQVFTAVYGANPQKVAEFWARSAGRGR